MNEPCFVFAKGKVLGVPQKSCDNSLAPGCGDTLLESSGETDAGGNKKIADVGTWLRDKLYDYFKKMQVHRWNRDPRPRPQTFSKLMFLIEFS